MTEKKTDFTSLVNVKYSYAEDLCFDAILWEQHVLQKVKQ